MSLNFNVENLPVYYSIELPCFMKNNEQALECVGGLETVQEHLARDTNLFFRFPGENPLKPALEGTTKQRPTLLLKLVRKRNKKTNQIVSQQAFVVGNIKKTVVFENPADYQFIPKSTKLSDYVEAYAKKSTSFQLETLPSSFSRLDPAKRLPQVLSYLLDPKRIPLPKDHAGGEGSDDDEEDDAQGHEGSSRKQKREDVEVVATIIKMGDPIPAGHPLGEFPPKWASFSKEYRGFQLLENIKRVLQSIPIISKKTLIELLGLGTKIHQFKEVLNFAAFTYGNGPFQHLWIRFGYDPTIDPSTRIYQQLNCRITLKFLTDMSASVTNYLGKEKCFRKMLKVDEKMLTDAPTEYSNSFIDKGSMARIPFDLFGTVIKHHTTFQVCRLTANEAIEFISRMAYLKSFHPSTGWYALQSMDALRSFIVDLLSRFTNEFLSIPIDQIEFQPAPPPNYDPNYFNTHWPHIEQFLNNNIQDEIVTINPKDPMIPLEIQWLKKYRQIDLMKSESMKNLDMNVLNPFPVTPMIPSSSAGATTSSTTRTGDKPSFRPVLTSNKTNPPPPPPSSKKSIEEAIAFNILNASDSEDD